MKAVLSNELKLAQVPEDIRQELIQQLQFANPKYLENQRMGRWNRGTPKVLKFYRPAGSSGLYIPRGFMRQLILLCRQQSHTNHQSYVFSAGPVQLRPRDT